MGLIKISLVSAHHGTVKSFYRIVGNTFGTVILSVPCSRIELPIS